MHDSVIELTELNNWQGVSISCTNELAIKVMTEVGIIRVSSFKVKFSVGNIF